MLLESTMDWLPADSGRGMQQGSPAIRGWGRLHGFRLRLCLLSYTCHVTEQESTLVAKTRIIHRAPGEE